MHERWAPEDLQAYALFQTSGKRPRSLNVIWLFNVALCSHYEKTRGERLLFELNVVGSVREICIVH